MIGLVAFIFGLVVAAAISVPFVLLDGWIVMLCLGALAHIFVVPALAIGFWLSCLVALILDTLFRRSI